MYMLMRLRLNSEACRHDQHLETAEQRRIDALVRHAALRRRVEGWAIGCLRVSVATIKNHKCKVATTNTLGPPSSVASMHWSETQP